MIVVDELLRQRAREGKPIRVGLAGAGAAARMIAVQLLTPVEGMRLVAVANRTPAGAARIYADEKLPSTPVTTAAALDDAIARGMYATAADAMLLCEAHHVDLIIDATGAVDSGAKLAMRAIEKRKHVVLVNTELDSTLGPILKVHADRAGVCITNTDGDEPGVAMNLVRYVRSIGLKPVATGNLKGMVDVYRTPETQAAFAAKYSMNPKIITSFADGTKLSMEATVEANATGFRVGRRGMYGPRCEHVNDIIKHLPFEPMLSGGLVDYALGAAPYTGAFVVVHEEHPAKQKGLAYFKMGDGPLYVFYTPYHLPQIQIAATIGRAALLRDATVAPLGAPQCAVATVAKKDLRAGEVLDGVGGFASYGVVENAGVFDADNLLPMGLSEGGRLTRDIRKDDPVTFADVELPAGRYCDALYDEQRRHFAGAR
jgi:predicted homoserine dehydrogenase-like protein